MKNEASKGNFLFSDRALDGITQGKSLFVASSKTFSRKVSCKDCGYLFLCPRCERSFAAASEHEFICPSCGNRESIPPFCPSCAGSTFFYPQIGASQIKTKLTELVKTSSLFETCALSEIDRFNLSQFTKVVVVSLDVFLTYEFDSFEQVVHKLIKLRKSFTGELVIQYRSDTLRKQCSDLDAALKQEMNIRKSFLYPPFGDLYKIRYRPRTKKALSEPDAKKLIATLFPIPLDSVISWTSKKRGLPYMEFSVRVKKNHPLNWKQLPQEFHVIRM